MKWLLIIISLVISSCTSIPKQGCNPRFTVIETFSVNGTSLAVLKDKTTEVEYLATYQGGIIKLEKK